MSQKKLGKGLSDLGLNELLNDLNISTTVDISSASQSPKSTTDQKQGKNSKPVLNFISVANLTPGRYQPRQQMDEQALVELADSIRTQGMIQPIVVRSRNNNQYEILAGERRWRAAQLAGLNQVPVIVRDIPDEAAMALALIENIQRQDLTALEEAQAILRLIEEFQMTHEQVAQTIGKSRSMVSNLLRLLNLTPSVKEMLAKGQLEMGHGRALLALPEEQQKKLAQQIIDKNLSVREAEKLVQCYQNLRPRSEKITTTTNINVLQTQKEIANKLGLKIKVHHNKDGKGKLIIHFNKLSELDKITNYFSN